MSISRRCFLSSRSEASRHIPSTIMVAPAKINSQTYRVSIAVSSCANFVVGDSKIFSTLFREELNLLSLASSDALRREQWICHPDKHCQPVDFAGFPKQLGHLSWQKLPNHSKNSRPVPKSV